MRPTRSAAYRAFVRRLPCSVCSRTWGIECCHTGDHGLSQKSPDTDCIPLCFIHHKDSRVGLDGIGRAAFEELHGVSVARIIRETQLRAEACGVRIEDKPERKPMDRGSSAGLRGSRLAR